MAYFPHPLNMGYFYLVSKGEVMYLRQARVIVTENQDSDNPSISQQ